MLELLVYVLGDSECTTVDTVEGDKAAKACCKITHGSMLYAHTTVAKHLIDMRRIRHYGNMIIE